MKIFLKIMLLAVCVSMLFSCTVSLPIVEIDDPLEDLITEVKDNKNYSMLVTEESNVLDYFQYFKVIRTISIKFDGSVKYIADTEINSVKYIEYAQGSMSKYNKRYIYTKEKGGWKKTTEENEESFEDSLDLHYINNLLVPDNFKKKDDLYISDIDVFPYDVYKSCSVVVDTKKKEITAEMIGEDEYGLEVKRTICISNIGSTALDKPYK
jgi:hypothetical protein